MFDKFALTDPVHRASYAGIDSKRPELSQAGRTVVITGGSSGIGYGIATGFVAASVARIFILGRRSDVLASAAKQLTETDGFSGEVIGLQCDMMDAAAVDTLWDKFRAEGVVVDVLVLNATGHVPLGPLLELGTSAVWKVFDANVRAQLQMTERFYKQVGKGASETKNLVHVSSASIHEFVDFGDNYLAYGASKQAGQSVLQMVAQDTPREKMQIVSFHPGAIFTEAAKTTGWTEDSLPWDNVNLPGDFAVWAASPEASFLHGRFVWAAWDVDQLKSGKIRNYIEENRDFLRVGVNGLGEGDALKIKAHGNE
ncbi:NAD(P)-binding protein [Nemania sp. FL0916]|nr:NAD(P)-binding protein [Nemania sp. FL0916]